MNSLNVVFKENLYPKFNWCLYFLCFRLRMTAGCHNGDSFGKVDSIFVTCFGNTQKRGNFENQNSGYGVVLGFFIQLQF